MADHFKALDADVTRTRLRIPALRRVRHRWTVVLAKESGRAVLKLAERLASEGGRGRFVACELVLNHPAAMALVGDKEIVCFRKTIGEWVGVDHVLCLMAGVAWRTGKIRTATIVRWGKSPDIWWRRAALVSTLPLNVAHRGGTGDARRTLRICRLVLHDREPMVVSALSMALRALGRQDPEAVHDFVAQHAEELPSLVTREVGLKLRTGRIAVSRAPVRASARLV